MRRVLFLGLLLASACADDPENPRYEFVPEMVDSVPFDTFSPNPVTGDGRTLIAPPPGTLSRNGVAFEYGVGNAEAERAGRELQNPIPPSESATKRGADLFRTFCTPCHGISGQGDGMIIPRFPAPPSLTANHARSLPDGRIYHIISRGQGVMPSHASQVSPIDRWYLVHFIRSLQSGAPSGGAK